MAALPGVAAVSGGGAAVHGGNPWAVLQPPAELPRQVLDFSANLNPLGPPPGWEGVWWEAAERVRWYPEPTYRALREAAADRFGLEPERVVPGSGAAELIHAVSRTCPGEPAAVADPTFCEYERAVRAGGGGVISWPYGPPRNSSEPWGGPEGFPEGAGTIYLCHPNNPTGHLWPRERLWTLARRCDRVGVRLVVDESYLDLTAAPAAHTVVPWLARFRGLVVIRSLTKCFSVPGLRVGFALASPETAERIRGRQAAWPVGGPAEFVGRWLLSRDDFLDSSRRLIGDWREAFAAGLRETGLLEPQRSAANFLLCRVAEGRCARALAERLKGRGILLRLCEGFRGLDPERFLRIAVRRPDENGRLLRALREAA